MVIILLRYRDLSSLLGMNEQSNKTVQLLALGWHTETAECLLGYIPGLAEDIARLRQDGLELRPPDGRMCFHIAADMCVYATNTPFPPSITQSLTPHNLNVILRDTAQQQRGDID